jgi:hypothetical protein
MSDHFTIAHRALAESENRRWADLVAQSRTDGAVLRRLTLMYKSELVRITTELREWRNVTWHNRPHLRCQYLRSRKGKVNRRLRELAQAARFYRSNSGE